MSRIGEGDFSWVAEQARRAAEAQAEARRLAEIERSKALAAAAPPALNPQNPAGPEALGQVLGEVQSMAVEARTAFTVQVARQSAPEVGLAPTPRDAASIVQALVDEAYPHGTDPRARLGQALLSFAGANAVGVGSRVLEAAVSQALASLAPGPATTASPAPARDVLERRPGAERFGGGRFDPPRVAPGRNVVSAPLNDPRPAFAPVTAPVTARTAVVASADVAASKKAQAAAAWAATSPGIGWSRAPATRDASVAADLDALSSALGGPRPTAPPPDAPAAEEEPLSWQQGRALAVPRLGWNEAAPRLLGANLTSLAGKAQSLYDKADRVRSLLLDAQGGGVPLRLGLIKAAGALDKVALRAGTAHELLGLRDSPRETLRSLAAARDQLRGVHSEAQTAVEALSGFQARMQGLPAAVAQVRDIAREARTTEREVGSTFARGSMLEAADSGAGLYAEEPVPEAAAEAPPAETAAEGPGVLTEAELARIGSGLDPSRPSPQTVWSEGMVNTVCDLGRQQGGCTDADGARHFELARMALGTEGADLQGPGHALEPTDLAAVLKMAGVPLETVDPAQLQSAARYVSSATSLTDQQDKLRKTLDNFQVLGTIGLPKLSRQQMVDQLWGMAKVPGHALQKLSDAEIQKKFQEVAGALNAGPGKSEIKIGKHTLKLELGEGGQILSTSCKKPSFLSKVWGVVKVVAPIALTVASLVFTGGTTLAIIKLAQAALSAVQAIKSKSLLGIAAAGAALFGGAAGLVNKGAGLAGRMATTAQAVSRSLQGVASIRRGDLLGGLASIGSGVAGGIAGVAGKMSEGLTKFSNQLSFYSNKLSALGSGVAVVRSYTSASKALDEARRAVAQARASGDPRQVAAAEKQLRQAESQKRTSILGSAAGALNAASLWVGDRAQFAGAPKLGPADPGLASQLQLLSRGLGVARDVSSHDYVSAAVGGLAVASNVDSARHGGASTSLTDASRIAEAGLGYYQAEKGLSSAQHAVDDAETRLIAARALGDSALVAQAEAELRQARRGIESAVMGDIGAGESLIGTAQSVAADRRVRPFLLRAQPTIDKAKGIGKGLDDLAHGSDTPEPLRKAAAEVKQLFDQATAGFQQAMVEARGDPAKEEAAKTRYEAAVATIDAHQQQIRIVLAGVGSGSGPGRGGPDTSAGPGYASTQPTSEGQGPAPATEPDAPATASSSRPTPERVGTLSIRPGMTLSEISLRTGVSVEALREFNASVGNELPGDRELPIGQQVHVPLGEGWQTNRPMDADQYADLVDQANRQAQGLPPIALPQLRIAEVPGIPEGGVIDLPHDRFEALKALDQDFKKIDEDVTRSKGQWNDPSTWIDTKEDDAKYKARDAYKQAVERLQSVLMDASTTKDQEQQAREALMRARLAFNQARGVTEEAAAQSDYLTPLKEIAQNAQDFLHKKNEEQRAAIVDRLTAAGVPPVLVGAATLPEAFFDEVVDTVGLGKGIVTQAQNVAGMVAHPIDTLNGLVALHERLQETDPMWRMSRFMIDVSTGKYATTDEAYAGLLKAADVREMAESGINLVVDMGKGFLEHPIELAKQGKYTEAWTTLIGENVNVAAVVGWMGRGAKIVEEGAELAANTERAAQAERLAAEARAAEQAALRGETTANAAVEGTQAGRTAGTITRKTAALDPKNLVAGSPEHKAGRWSEYQARGGEWSYDRWSKTYDRNMVRATQANAAVDDFWRQLGWGRREVLVDVEGVPRKLDIGDVLARRAVEYKTGYQTATQETLWEVARDQILIEQGWNIRWHFKGTVSEPLLKALRDAGIPYSIGK